MSPRLRRLTAGVAGAAAVIAVLTVVSRVVGFARGLVFTATVGNGAVGEAYNAANTVPNVLFEVVAGGALAGAVVPLLAGPLVRGDRREVDRTTGALLGWTLVLLVPVAALMAALAGPLAQALRGGREGAPAGLVAAMLVVFAPQVVLYGVGIVLTGALQAQRRFVAPVLAPLASSLVVIGAYLAYAAVTPDGALGAAGDGAGAGLGAARLALLAGGTTLGVLVLTLPLLVPVLRSGVRPRPTLRFPPGVLVRARSLAGAGLAALLAQQAAVLTALVLGARLGNPAPGSFSVFVAVVQPVYLLPYAVLAVPLATSAFQRLASEAATGATDAFARTAAGTTRAVLVVAALGAAGLVAVAPAVEALYSAVDPTGGAGVPYAAVSTALTAMAPGVCGFALVASVGRALYALERGRDAASATVAGWLVVVGAQVVLAAVLPGDLRVVAMAGGTSVGMTVAGALLLRALRRAAGPAAVTGTPRSLAAALLGAVVGAVGGRLVVEALLAPGGGPLAAVASGAAGGAVVVPVLLAAVAVLDRSALAPLAARLPGRRRDATGPSAPPRKEP